jgi:hypothetical protein
VWATGVNHRSAQAGERFTQLSLRDVRAEALLRVLRARRVERVEDIPSLAELWTWPRHQISQAIDTLVADGRLDEDARGCLIVRRQAA